MAGKRHTMRRGARSIFSPGQFVLCFNDEPEDLGPNIEPLMDGLARGKVYTIRWSGRAYTRKGKAYDGVRLEEIARDSGTLEPKQIDHPFMASRFRPLPDGRLDVFRAALTKANLREAV
ncbi:MAG: hypothetical protein WA975_03435 [Mesorhizobium sp.]